MCTMQNTLNGVTANYTLQKEKLVSLRHSNRNYQTETKREKTLKKNEQTCYREKSEQPNKHIIIVLKGEGK